MNAQDIKNPCHRTPKGGGDEGKTTTSPLVKSKTPLSFNALMPQN
jgi:hypothetical protein